VVAPIRAGDQLHALGTGGDADPDVRANRSKRGSLTLTASTPGPETVFALSMRETTAAVVMASGRRSSRARAHGSTRWFGRSTSASLSSPTSTVTTSRECTVR
jgi:hypothetical protein